MQPKAKFDMPKLRRKCRTMLKKQYGKVTKSLTVLDKVWLDYVKYGLVEELIKNGKVQVDKNFSIEIVGRKIVDDPRMFGIFSRGVGIRGEVVTKGANLTKGRADYYYDIVVIDKSYREGPLYFKANPKISRAVHDALVNTNHYYRIRK